MLGLVQYSLSGKRVSVRKFMRSNTPPHFQLLSYHSRLQNLFSDTNIRPHHNAASHAFQIQGKSNSLYAYRTPFHQLLFTQFEQNHFLLIRARS